MKFRLQAVAIIVKWLRLLFLLLILNELTFDESQPWWFDEGSTQRKETSQIFANVCCYSQSSASLPSVSYFSVCKILNDT